MGTRPFGGAEAQAGQGACLPLQKSAWVLTEIQPDWSHSAQQAAPLRSVQSDDVLQAVSFDWRMSKMEHWPFTHTGLKYLATCCVSPGCWQGAQIPAVAQCWLFQLMARPCCKASNWYSSPGSQPQQSVLTDVQSVSALQAPQSSLLSGQAARHAARVANRLALPPQPP